MPPKIVVRARSNYALAEAYVNNMTGTEGYIKKDGSTCPICQKMWSDCIGHRIGMILPFYFINPPFIFIILHGS